MTGEYAAEEMNQPADLLAIRRLIEATSAAEAA
jgi:hypothetical protein